VETISPPPFVVGANPIFVAKAEDQLFFSLPGGQLWKTDGTAAGTLLLAQMGRDETPLGGPFTTLGRSVFFSAGAESTELWKNDGVIGGTMLLKDQFHFGSSPTDQGAWFFAAGKSLYFAREDEQHSTLVLWKTDGTTAGTTAVRKLESGLNQGSEPYGLTPFDGKLLFWSRGIDPRGDRSSWLSDGTEDGTVPWGFVPAVFGARVELNGKLFYQDFDAATGAELWSADGTAGGTHLVKDINPGPNGSFPQNLTKVDDTLFFAVEGGELWRTDGSEPGTTKLKTFISDPDVRNPFSLLNFNGTLVFWTFDTSARLRLWKSDGTEPGTLVIKDNLSDSFNTHMPFAILNRNLYFATENQLWKSDGTEAGTIAIKALQNVYNLTVVNGSLYFTAESGLWKSDGTSAGTVEITKVYASSPVELNGSLYFASGSGLWKSDGTEVGTTEFKQIDCLSPRIGDPPPLLPLDGRLFFANSGGKLWQSDGTESGTTLVPTQEELRIDPFSLINVNGVLFFIADDGINGRELWKFKDRDADHDGLPDWWEAEFFSGNAAPDQDADNDGLTNWQESRAGTNPRDPNSNFQIVGIEASTIGVVRISWSSVANHRYNLLRSSTLDSKQYSVLETNIIATPPLNSRLIRNPSESRQSFYRLELEQ
jgi:ELWxxDGT repeat protein